MHKSMRARPSMQLLGCRMRRRGAMFVETEYGHGIVNLVRNACKHEVERQHASASW